MRTLVLTWADIESDIDLLANKLPNILKAPIKDYAVLTVTCGGLIPAGLLAYKLGIRSFETVNVRSYLDKKRGNFEILNPINNYS
jgi:hypoxanthine phosphoribosyltransferase